MAQLTVTVGIPTYNEAKNIVPLLRSILNQEEAGFVLEKVIVMDDASTDDTAYLVRDIADPRVQVYVDGERIGKNSRMNLLLGMVRTDVFVQFDADVTLLSRTVLRELLLPFQNEHNFPALVCGDHAPRFPKTWIENVVYFGEQVWLQSLLKTKGSAEAFQCYGHIRAFSKDFCTHFRIPEGVPVNEDLYSYIWAQANGYTIVVAPLAVVQYKLPDTYWDYKKQFQRTLAFQSETLHIAKTLHVSLPVVQRSVLLGQLLRRAIQTRLDIVLGFILIRLIFKLLRSQKQSSSVWDVAVTTKDI